MSPKPEICTDHYDKLFYRCSECGQSEVYSGSAVEKRNPERYESDCFMCEMVLVHAERYWSGEIVPDKVTVWGWPSKDRDAVYGGSG